MNRREFVALTTAMTASSVLPAFAGMNGAIEYSPGLINERLATGETLFLDFSATWCSTCKAQERVLNDLKAENPAYDQAITFVNVDWDEHGTGKLSQSLNIPRRSTLVVLKGNQELGRVVAGTSKAVIKELMDTALAAATN